MKKFISVLLTLVATIALAVCLGACNKDSESDAGDTARMAEVAGRYAATYMKTEINGTTVAELTVDIDESRQFLTLNSDGTCAVTSPDGTSNGTWKAKNNDIQLILKSEQTNVSFTFKGTIDGNALSVSSHITIPNYGTETDYLTYTKTAE